MSKCIYVNSYCNIKVLNCVPFPRRYWNDFIEFERFKPKQLFIRPIQAMPTSPAPDILLKNGGILDDANSISTQTQPLPVPVPSRDLAYVQPSWGIQWQPFLQSLLPSFHRQRLHPPGLVNKKRKNLCSVNVILQALACTPQLVEGLNRDKHRIKNVENLREFITELMNVLSSLHANSVDLVSTECLLQVADSLNPPHPQTDCVEWLMWLLELIHNGFIPPGKNHDIFSII